MSKKDDKILGIPNNEGIKLRMGILEGILGKSPNLLGLDAGLGNTTADGWNDKQIGKPTLAVKEFLKYYNIRLEWWEKLEEPIFNKKHAPVDKASDNNEKAKETIYKDLVESNSEYRLVPKIILDSYEIIPKRELEERAAIVRQALDAKDDVIGQLKKEIAQLRSGELIIMHPQKTE